MVAIGIAALHSRTDHHDQTLGYGMSNYECVHKCLYYYQHHLTGLHLGNDSRGGKIRFYESKGGQWCKDPCA